MSKLITAFQKTVRVALLCVALCTACSGPAATPVPTASPVPTSGPTATPAVDLAGTMDTLLSNLTEQGFFSGSVLVARNGEILLSEGYGLADREQNLPNTPDTKFRLASVSKQFTAMSILILENQGKVDILASVCTYIPDCPEAWQPITLHHLLTHTSGLTDTLDESLASAATPPSVEHTVSLFRETPLTFAPGAKWVYSSPGYVLLAYVIEQVSGQTYGAFLRHDIFDPLGMTSSGWVDNLDGLAIRYDHADDVAPTHAPNDATFWSGSGGLFSTVEDLYRWHQALYTETLIPQAALDRMFSVQTEHQIYGYGWGIDSTPGHRVVYHPGGMPGVSTEIDRYIDADVVVIVLSNQGSANAQEVAQLLATQMALPIKAAPYSQ